MTTKLEIIGPYTPEHEGPFCTRDKTPVEILTKKDRNGSVLGYQGDSKNLTEWCGNGQFDKTRMSDTAYDLMNAREVPAAREFWIYEDRIFTTEEEAKRYAYWTHQIIHVREVLPGESA